MLYRVASRDAVQLAEVIMGLNTPASKEKRQEPVFDKKQQSPIDKVRQAVKDKVRDTLYPHK